MDCIITLLLAVVSLISVVQCDKSRRDVKAHGRIYKAEVISFEKRRERTGGGIRHTVTTWYYITVKVSDGLGNTIERIVRTDNIKARKYQNAGQLDVVVLSDGESLAGAEKLIIIKEDIRTSVETLISLILFAVFLLLFILCITGRVAELIYR